MSRKTELPAGLDSWDFTGRCQYKGLESKELKALASRFRRGAPVV